MPEGDFFFDFVRHLTDWIKKARPSRDGEWIKKARPSRDGKLYYFGCFKILWVSKMVGGKNDDRYYVALFNESLFFENVIIIIQFHIIIS